MTRIPRKPLPDYGYRLSLNSPMIRTLYERYKRAHNIPIWCPLSDSERHDFELAVLGAMAKKEKREKGAKQ